MSINFVRRRPSTCRTVHGPIIFTGLEVRYEKVCSDTRKNSSGSMTGSVPEGTFFHVV
jgi:hypothetical protein